LGFLAIGFAAGLLFGNKIKLEISKTSKCCEDNSCAMCISVKEMREHKEKYKEERKEMMKNHVELVKQYVQNSVEEIKEELKEEISEQTEDRGN